MTHFAKVENGMVTQVIVAEQDFIDTLPDKNLWIQTSYNTRGNTHYDQDGNPDGGIALRGNYAGVGYSYDAEKDVFIPPQPFPSWVLSPSMYIWKPPVAMPDDGNAYYWDESTVSWKQITEELA